MDFDLEKKKDDGIFCSFYKSSVSMLGLNWT